jgi:hypothetical protein
MHDPSHVIITGHLLNQTKKIGTPEVGAAPRGRPEEGNHRGLPLPIRH